MKRQTVRKRTAELKGERPLEEAWGGAIYQPDESTIGTITDRYSGKMQGGEKFVEDVNAAKLKVKQSKLLEWNIRSVCHMSGKTCYSITGLSILGSNIDFSHFTFFLLSKV